ncbi:putative 2OG-Fe(II) oxygenase [Rheinheimera fenheensis]|uniref:putative 2OG-Fe(II) oxygenase n=1 Tax=Rheinheimera fenheensis TaxID=3152295 RepID=UPI003260514A
MTNKLEPSIFPVFATPFVTIDVPDAPALNMQLEQFCDRLLLEKNKHENPRPHNYVQESLFESNFDLFKYNDPSVQVLKGFILQSVGWVIAKLNNYTKTQLDNIQLFADAWVHVTEFGGYFHAHNHPMASWSAVYCINPGTTPTEKPDSGTLRFFDTRPHANSYIDAGNANLVDPYGFGNYNFKLRPGQLIIFPSYLQHEVAPFMGHDRRITVAVNCWSNRYGS